MREILFRGKRADKWVYGYFCGMDCELIFSKPKESSQIIDQDGFWHSVIPETVGQYTGLTDKNGKKIFEGDILASDWNGENRIQGYIKNDEWNCDCCDGVYGWELIGIGDLRNYDSFFIIGNIYDNPELIESEVETE